MYAKTAVSAGLDWACERHRCSTSPNQVALAYLDNQVVSCQNTVQNLKCERLMRSHPGMKTYARKCDIESICRENSKPIEAIALLKSCGSSIGPAALDRLIKFVKSPYSIALSVYQIALFVGANWSTEIKSNSERIKKAYQLCASGDSGKLAASLVDGPDGSVIVAPNIGAFYANLSCNEIIQRVAAYRSSLSNTQQMSLAREAVPPQVESDSGPSGLPQQVFGCMNVEGRVYAACYYFTAFGTDVVLGIATGAAVNGLLRAIRPAAIVRLSELDGVAKSLGSSVQTFKKLYRLDSRTPREIIEAGGFRPNPLNSAGDASNHSRGMGTNRFVSTSARTTEGMQSNEFFQGKWVGPATGNKSANVFRTYEYQIAEQEGVPLPKGVLESTENEVLTTTIPSGKVVRYRTITQIVDTTGATTVERGDWLPLPAIQP